MSNSSLLHDAFAHYGWATLRLIDACLQLTPEQLATAAPATYGSIRETLAHIVEGDAFDLRVLQGEPSSTVESTNGDLHRLRALAETNDAAWRDLLAQDLDASAMVLEVDPDDGYRREAPVGLRLAQVLHHGSDHRTQVCAALSLLGLEPPRISVWDFATAHGRIREVYPGD